MHIKQLEAEYGAHLRSVVVNYDMESSLAVFVKLNEEWEQKGLTLFTKQSIIVNEVWYIFSSD